MSDYSLKCIEDVEVGDYVLSFREENPTSGDFKSGLVVRIHTTPDVPVLKVGGVGSTHKHEFVSGSGIWEDVDGIDEALTRDGRVMPLDKLDVGELATVHNLEVQSLHTDLVVGTANGQKVHWRVHNGRSYTSTRVE